MHEKQAHILVVDDTEYNREILTRQLERMQHQVKVAIHGKQALELLCQHTFDLILLDIMMPEMNGYQVLEYIKNNEQLRYVPVIIISAVDQIDSIVRCIELGAEDYLTKPFNRVLLRARVSASLEKKWLRDHEQAYLQQIEEERSKSERLLLNILPAPIAVRLKQGESVIADTFDEVTVMFADIAGFTPLSAQTPAKALVASLNEVFSRFDRMTEKYGLEKIKTIGDAYMIVGGLPTPRPDHASAIADMALDMQAAISEFHLDAGAPFQLRVGINTGPVIAGVIGEKKFSYDLWGDTVNTASRMESQGIVGRIQLTDATRRQIESHFVLEERGLIEVKGKGPMRTYLLVGRKG